MNFGNWYRRIVDMPGCVVMGVQFLIGYEDESQSVTREQWKAAARQLGLYYWLQAPPDEATFMAEASDPFCIGWNQHDEPNDASPTLTDIGVMSANYLKWHATGKRVMANFDGSQRWSGFDYAKAYGAPIADDYWFDYYVRNRDGPNANISMTVSEVITYHKSQGLPDHIKVGFFLETDNQNLAEQGDWAKNGCGPTAADIDEYFNWAKIAGISYVACFEDVIGKWFENYGETSQEIFAAIQRNMRQYATPLAGSLIPQVIVPMPTPVPVPAGPLSIIDTGPVKIVPVPPAPIRIITPTPITIHQRTAIHLNRRVGKQTVVVYDDGSQSKINE